MSDLFHDRRPELPWLTGPTDEYEDLGEGRYRSRVKGWTVHGAPESEVTTPQCTATMGNKVHLTCGGAEGHEHPHVFMTNRKRVTSISRSSHTR